MFPCVQCYDVCSVTTCAVLRRVQNRSSHAFPHFAAAVIISGSCPEPTPDENALIYAYNIYLNPKDIQKNVCIISCSLFHCKALKDIWLIVVQINEIIGTPDVIMGFNYI